MYILYPAVDINIYNL